MSKETGPRRAQRRAAAVGLVVGAPVRALVMTKAGPGPQRELTPRDFGQRITAYRLQAASATHTVPGSGWMPTPRQQRRLMSKARTAKLRAELARRATDLRRVAPLRELVESGAVIHPDSPAAPRVGAWNEPARLGVTPPVMMENPPKRGFTMIDRRGEHRS